MKMILLINKVLLNTFCLLVATCTNDLVIHAKQVNYFEMFLLSFAMETKNVLFVEQIGTFEKIKTEISKLSKFFTTSFFQINPVSN